MPDSDSMPGERVSDDSGFSLISESLPPGAMTDGAKRRDDTSPVEIVSKKFGLSTGAAPVSSHDLPPFKLSGYTASLPTCELKPLEVVGTVAFAPSGTRPEHLGSYHHHLGKV